MADQRLERAMRAASVLTGEDEVFDELLAAWLRGDRHVARMTTSRLRLWDFLRGLRAVADGSAAFRRARARERLATAALAELVHDATELGPALAEAELLLAGGQGEARDRTTMAD